MIARFAPLNAQSGRLLAGGSLAALALAVSFAPTAARAQQQPFGTMVGMQAGRTIGPNGQVSVWQGANRPTIGVDADGRPLMTIEQLQQKALLDWEDFRLQTNEVLEFKQQAANWIAVNRVHGTQAAEVNGEIRAIGRVYIFNDNGVLIGEDAKINTRALVTGRGFSDVNVNGNTTTLVQSAERALLDWSDMSVAAGEVLKFQQEKSSWIALNRSYNTGVTRIDGKVEANGHLYLVAPRGISVDGTINAQQLVLSSLFMRDDQFFGDGSNGGLTSWARDFNGRFDPTFSNSWYYPSGQQGYNPLGFTDWISQPNYFELMNDGPEVVDPNDPLKYNVTIGRTGTINTGSFGKVMLFGPNVTNKGTINVRDEGQVILAAGENIYLRPGNGGMLETYVGAFNPFAQMRPNVAYGGQPPQLVESEEWRAFYSILFGREITLGEYLSYEDYQTLTQNGHTGEAGYIPYGRIVAYLNQRQYERAHAVGYTARNEGIISAKRGGSVDFRGLNLEQMGAVDITSTALFRGNISFHATVYDWREYANSDTPGWEHAVKGHGSVVFGRNSLTQITPDLDSTDAIPVSLGAQSVGTLKINARTVHMQQDSIIHMPSGTMNVLLDSGAHIFDNNRGQGANQGNEDGTRFLMDAGALIDLSGWETTLDMGYHQVTGRLFAAQLSDSPVQRDGPLYRREISVDRRFGTNLANWQGFDNLSQGTLAQFLVNGGSLTMDIGNDFIMKSGSVIDVSGGVTTYREGYVYTTLLRRLDGSIIDIREADPDELYMGLADEWVDYDTKWGRSQSYYIPLMSSVRGQFETSYQHGGKGGSITILAPDTVLQGTLRGETVAGRYQRANVPVGGSFALNDGGESENEYVSNTVLITALENALDAQFGMGDRLSDRYDDLFGEEFDPETDSINVERRTSDNATLASADFFNRSTMGSYTIVQSSRVSDQVVNNYSVPLDGPALLVEAGATLNLQNGASLTLEAAQRLEFLGSVRTEGGDVQLTGMGVRLGETTRIDTRGSWYSDFEVDEPIALSSVPRIHGGNITLTATGSITDAADIGLVLPSSAVLDASGGAWVTREGKLIGGTGGDLTLRAYSYNDADALDLGALSNARAYGLAGNGRFTLEVSKPLVIGDSLPVPDGQADADALTPLLIRPDFFRHSGFSAISLVAPTITVQQGAQIEASASILQLKDQTLYNGRPPAFWSASGTDIYDVAQVEYLTVEQRPEALRRGMDISFGAVGGTIDMGEGSLLSTELGGKISLLGNSVVAGTILTPAGVITLGGGGSGGATETFVSLAATARLLAPGAALVTWRGIDAMGRPIVDGEIFDGGSISLGAKRITIAGGAVLDVSGTSATFDYLFDDGQGGLVRRPTLVASNGGAISISGQIMKIDGAIYRAHAGGIDARGGRFQLSFDGPLATGGGGGGAAVSDVLNLLEAYTGYGIIIDKSGNPISNIYEADLGEIDWAYLIGYPIDFPPGYTLGSRDAALATFSAYGTAASGVPPMLIIGDASGIAIEAPELPFIAPGLLEVFGRFGYVAPTPVEGDPIVTTLSPTALGTAGFSSIGITANPGVIFSGDVTLGGRNADGSFVFDRIDITAGRIIGVTGSDVALEAGIITLNGGPLNGQPTDGGYLSALASYGVAAIGADTRFSAQAGTLLQVGAAGFHGFSDTTLISGGDIRLAGTAAFPRQAPLGVLHSNGLLTLKADQVYAGTGRIFSVTSDTGIVIQAQDDGGPINGSPYEVAAQLTFKAPTILQGGTLRSPLGTLNLEVYDNGTEGSGTLRFLSGSLTSVSAEGRVVPYGYTSNGDTWIDPFTRTELTTLPVKTINVTGDVVDIQQNAVLDVSGGGDLYAREFVPGVGGSYDWLTGYRDENLDWVSAADKVYAVIPDFDGNVAPLGFGNSAIGVGDRVYLSGGSGLPAGYYVLLPAEYAMLKGAYRVTASHRYGDQFDGVRLGRVAPQTDGSSIQAGYRIDGASGARDPLNIGFHVMSGETLRMRSAYLETTANLFFTSDAFLRKSLRINRPISDVPRIPTDGGSVVFRVADDLNLDGTLRSQAATGGRGGFADIASTRVVVTGSDTDLAAYDGYLKLDSEQLSAFGAESLLIGGVRRQGATNLELTVAGTDIIVDNAGSVLFGPELLFASNGTIDVKAGARIETRGTISGTSSDIRIAPGTAAFTHDNDTNWTGDDDYLVHGALDQGAVLRVSSGAMVDVLRDSGAVQAMNALRADPAALAQVNALRASKGLAAIDASGGLLTIADGASITSTRSVVLDATDNTILGARATLQTKQLSAAASRVSLGAVPLNTGGLVFAGNTLGLFANAEELTLKSYGSIDIYGALDISATGDLRLDSNLLRVIDAGTDTVSIAAKTLTLANSSGGQGAATIGDANLVLQADTLYIEGATKWISGVADVRMDVAQRIIGRDDTRLVLPGTLDIHTGGLTAESSARLNLDVAGAVTVSHNGAANLPVFQSFGGTLNLSGDSIVYAGQTRMTGGTISLQARSGNLVLAEGSVLDVTSNVSRFYDATVGVGAGTVNLTADDGDVIAQQGSVIDVSGSSVGGDAGTLAISVGQGEAQLRGTIRGSANDGFASGSFRLLTDQLADFAAFNALLDVGGFRQSRRFEINRGDVSVTGTIDVRNFALVVNQGSIAVGGTIQTSGANGGTVQLAASQNVTLLNTGRLIARAGAADGSGGTVLLETAGANGGAITTQAGALIDVSGSGEGGRLVRFRAPQIGNDIAITSLGGTITGARSVLAEGYRSYDGVAVIDQAMIDRVEGDASAFMAANAAAIRNRLGNGVTLAAGIELRNDGDMQLQDDWDLSGLRFDGAAGVLTLRASGDIRIDANLSDGFADGRLLDGDSWTFNLAAGANILSPNSLAVLPTGLLGAETGSVIVGGTTDTIEYYYDPAYGNEHRLYLLDANGQFVRNPETGVHNGFVELTRDPATGKYIDPRTGALIEMDAQTGDYADADAYARRPLPWMALFQSGFGQLKADGSLGFIDSNGLGEISTDLRDYIQWNNSTGYLIRTGTGAMNIATGRDLVLQERASVIYTAGRAAAELTGFSTPAGAQYGVDGGDLVLSVAGDVRASSLSPQLPHGYLGRSGSLDTISGLFAARTDGGFDQTSWWVDYDRFQGGIGALGGGNIAIEAGGDIDNLSVAIPNSGRVTGNTVKLADGSNTAMELTLTGGGNLTLRAGGNLYGGAYHVASGAGDMGVGGSILSGSTVFSTPQFNCTDACYIHQDFREIADRFDLYTMFFTSSGQLNVRAGGDLNVESVMDPLIGESNYQDWRFVSYTGDASANFFSAGGDVTLWTNGLNISLAYESSGASTAMNRSGTTVNFYGSNERPMQGRDSIGWDLYPSKLSVVAATGDVNLLGGLTMLPDAGAELDLLAGGSVRIGYSTEAIDPLLPRFGTRRWDQNYRGAYQGVQLSQADMALIRTPTNQPVVAGGTVLRTSFEFAGAGTAYPGVTYFNVNNLPDLYIGNTDPVRIYAAGGDVVTSPEAVLNIPKQLWVQAEGNIYFPSYSIQHNNMNDVSIVRAGAGIYFDRNYTSGNPNGGFITVGHVTVSGPGRLEVEAGTDIWIPSNSEGITSKRIAIYTYPGSPNQPPSGLQDWKPDEKAADIAIAAGYNQAPSYAAFEAAYLDPTKAGAMADYLIDEESGLSLYLFDRDYARAQGATGEFATPEPREGLVNYVRRLQGLPTLTSKAAQLAYLDSAWAFWQGLSSDYKTPYYRSILFLELRTTGREANDPQNERYDTTFRGYDAIATLFPGAQRAAGEALSAGESRWQGNFETYASRVVSSGGGKIEFVIPGGAMTLANVAARPEETGQPANADDRGNALRAGVLTTDGGEINMLTHGSVAVNQSRILTSKGGNVMIWSSWGDIAAGLGAKTSISPQFYNYQLDNWGRMVREPAGLPTGAGIGTLATQPGTPPADVDLIAPAGIVDAGDAGIRVSGNFNVYAIEILGTDNIDVAGVSNGLPAPPAAPPTALDVDEVAAKSDAVSTALESAVAAVRENAAIVAPSLIEVRVTGFGAACDEDDSCERQTGQRTSDAGTSTRAAVSATIPVALQFDAGGRPEQFMFQLQAQPLDDAIRAVGSASGYNILYDASILEAKMTQPLRGEMTPERALAQLLAGQGLIAVRVGPRTIMLRRKSI
ncbi:filamentous haemagglutinin family protein [Sphingomonas sp. 37zxx]|uniref:filamentous haemagglutinin family protein n=1 Tax=Sphingomonas sp. 37zxx TaxID=1550073 RepID=UPI00053BE7E4|nr:filamentous haemagglutinin family protein [Sphingomonas sp. 37zxx]